MFMLATYVNDDGELTVSSRPLSKHDISKKLHVDIDSVHRFLKRMRTANIISGDDVFKFNDKMFFKGKIDYSMLQALKNNDQTVIRIGIDAMRRLYHQTPPSGRSVIATPLRLIPFIGGDKNVICTDPLGISDFGLSPMSVGDLCYVLGKPVNKTTYLRKSLENLVITIDGQEHNIIKFVKRSDKTSGKYYAYVSPRLCYRGKNIMVAESCMESGDEPGEPEPATEPVFAETGGEHEVTTAQAGIDPEGFAERDIFSNLSLYDEYGDFVWVKFTKCFGLMSNTELAMVMLLGTYADQSGRICKNNGMPASMLDVASWLGVDSERATGFINKLVKIGVLIRFDTMTFKDKLFFASSSGKWDAPHVEQNKTMLVRLNIDVMRKAYGQISVTDDGKELLGRVLRLSDSVSGNSNRISSVTAKELGEHMRCTPDEALEICDAIIQLWGLQCALARRLDNGEDVDIYIFPFLYYVGDNFRESYKYVDFTREEG